jgi:hypothetical protein
MGGHGVAGRETNMGIDSNERSPPALMGLMPENGALIFFPVSIAKFAVLSVCSLGIYNLYWFYRNWQLVRAREHSDISPFWRATFAYFFCYAMFKQIRDHDRQSGGTGALPAGALATGWIVLTLLWQMPDRYWLAALLSFAFMLPAQIVANRINSVAAPNHDRNTRFTGWNWLTVVIGGAIIVLDALGEFAVPEI